jgi:hypothetical protein
MKKKTVILSIVLLAVAAFLLWRFIRPMNIFVISEAFERPIDTSSMPASLKTLRAEECGTCHQDYYKEWQTTVHSHAWTDPYFQVDWTFEGKEQICRNCHTPLDRQQEHRVLGFHDSEKWDPILAANPAFDPALQHEGVTCAGCHLRAGKILGPNGLATAAHPVTKMEDPNQMCVRCHVVGGQRWDAFYRFPPCGTVAEMEAGRGARKGRSGEARVANGESLQCVECHMPRVRRPLVPGGELRPARQHLWRGGHDPAMVSRALTVALQADSSAPENVFRYRLALTNTGTAHYLPTGTPDRHLSVVLRFLAADGSTVKQTTGVLKRTVMWRPFIVDLWDTRLAREQPRLYTLEYPRRGHPAAAAVEAVVRYHLLEEARRRRIGYENKEPIDYEVFRQQIALPES